MPCSWPPGFSRFCSLLQTLLPLHCFWALLPCHWCFEGPLGSCCGCFLLKNITALLSFSSFALKPLWDEGSLWGFPLPWALHGDWGTSLLCSQIPSGLSRGSKSLLLLLLDVSLGSGHNRTLAPTQEASQRLLLSLWLTSLSYNTRNSC